MSIDTKERMDVKTNVQKVRERPLCFFKPRQWMLCNYGTPIGIFRTRRELLAFAERDGRDMKDHEIRVVLVFDQGVGGLLAGRKVRR